VLTKEQFEAWQKYFKCCVEFNELFLKCAEHDFTEIKMLEKWRDKNYKEMERLRKIWQG